MEYLWQGMVEALRRLGTLDASTYQALGLSLAVAGSAVVAAAAVGVPLGAWVGLKKRRWMMALANTSMAVPSVFVGLLLYGFFSRKGPLGPADLLYTPVGMAIGQAILALPLIVALTAAALERADPRVYATALTLGATPARAFFTVLREYRPAIVAAVAAGFARAVTEVGCAMIVGGNIKDKTRLLTTAIVTESNRGEFATALAMGLVLVIVALIVNLTLRRWVVE